MAVYPVLQRVWQKDEHLCCDAPFCIGPKLRDLAEALAEAAGHVGGKCGDSEPRFHPGRAQGLGVPWGRGGPEVGGRE